MTKTAANRTIKRIIIVQLAEASLAAKKSLLKFIKEHKKVNLLSAIFPSVELAIILIAVVTNGTATGVVATDGNTEIVVNDVTTGDIVTDGFRGAFVVVMFDFLVVFAVVCKGF